MKSSGLGILVFAIVACFATPTVQGQKSQQKKGYRQPIYDPGFVLDEKGNRIDQTGSSPNGYRNFPTPRWTSTVTDGGGLAQGDPTTLTWSIIPDGTFIRSGVGEPAGNSSMIAWLDGVYGGSPGGSDLTQRPWWALMDSALTRFSDLSGLTYVYEPNDDGANHIDTFGQSGVRGDVRIGAKFIDGNFGILGYNFGPNSGDMVLDANDSYYGGLGNNSARLRNVFSHEHGHGLGFAHVIPVNQTKLMEPFATTNPLFTGPQFDDILNLHRQYGDVYEKSNGGNGNNIAANATPLGTVNDGATVKIGTSAVGLTSSLLSNQNAVDFISVDDNSDTDFLSFTISANASVDLVLTPVGPTYSEGPQGGSTSNFFTARLSDLTLALVDTNGTTVLNTSNSGGLGVAEQILGESLAAGTYFARVTGANNNVQMYQLEVSATYDTAVLPDSYKLADGVLVNGQIQDLHASDDQYFEMDPTPTQNLLKQRIDLIVQSQSPTTTPSAFSFRVESKMIGGPVGDVIQFVELFNYQTNVRELVDTRPAQDADESVEIALAGNLSRFVNPINREITAFVTWKSESFAGPMFTWSIDADETVWLIEE